MPAAYMNEDGNTVKVCAKCGVLKDVDAFSGKKAAKDGKYSSCKECVNSHNAYRNAKPENKIANRKRVSAYEATPEGKAKKAAYRATPEGKAKIAAANATYRATPEGKAKKAASNTTYRATPEGKAKNAGYKAAYYATPEGRAKVNACAVTYYYRKNPNAVPGANGYRTNQPGFVYVVSGGGFLKVGITNNKDQRLATHRYQGLTDVVHVWEFPDGADARAIEQIWKEHLETLPRLTKEQLEDGWTEATYDTDAVGDWIVQNLEPIALAA